MTRKRQLPGPLAYKPERKTIPNSNRKTSREPIIELHPNAEYPPAMARLTDNRKRFVIAAVKFPDVDNNELARLAGIGNEKTGRSEVWNLLHDDTVIAAIQEYAQQQFGQDAPLFRKRLREHVLSRDPKISLKAVEIGLRYSGLTQSPIKHVHEHEVELTTDALLERLRTIYAENPELRRIEDQSINAGNTENPAVIDCEFTEVPERIASLSNDDEKQTREAA